MDSYYCNFHFSKMILGYLFIAYLVLGMGLAIYEARQEKKHEKESEEIMKYYYEHYK